MVFVTFVVQNMMNNLSAPRPLFPIALAFISGIAVFDCLLLPLAWLLSITVVIALFFIITLIIKSLRHSVLADILLIGLCFLAGAVRLLVANQIPANHIAKFPHDDVPMYLKGIVIDEPIYYQAKNEFLAGDMKQEKAGYFTVNAETLAWGGQGDNITGKVRVSFYGVESEERLSAVKYGNRLQLLGIIYSPRRPTNPGEFDYGQFLRRQGVYKTLRIKNPDNIKLISANQGNPAWKIITRIRNFLCDRVDGYFEQDQSSLLKALLLGERPAVPDIIETKFMQTGTIHFLSVSGLHLAMLVGFLFLILGGLGVTGRKRAVLLIIAAILYALLTGFSTPVARSLVMVVVYLGAEIFTRKSNPFNSLALAGMIIMAYNPQEVFSVGFQLSFLSVISIVSFTTPILTLMRYKNIGTDIPAFIPLTLRERLGVIIKKYLVNAVAVSVAATLGVFPLVLMYFHLITPVSIITNIVLAPLVFLIMLFGFINMPLAALGVYSWLMPILSFLTWAVVGVVDLFSRIPFAYFYLPDIPAVFIWIFYGLFFLWLVRGRLYSLFSRSVITIMASTASDEVTSGKCTPHLSSPLRGEGSVRGNLIWAGALIIMLGWFLIWAFSTGMPRQQDGLTLTMLDVRQGASFAIQTPGGKTILYDCGTFGARDVGEQVVAPFLWKKGITQIDTLILSHSHLDHINGVQSILEKFPIKEVLVSPHFSGSYWGKLAMQLFGHYGIRVSAISQGDVVNLGEDVIAEIMGPSDEKISDNENDLSLVLKIRHANKSILLCGDIQAKGIKNLLEGDKDLSADILQIPHHGFALKPDKTGRNYLEELITRVTPSEIVINTDGDELDEGILAICRARDIVIHTSDRDGAVTINLR